MVKWHRNGKEAGYIVDIKDGDKKETGCYPVSTSPVEGLFAKKLVID